MSVAGRTTVWWSPVLEDEVAPPQGGWTRDAVSTIVDRLIREILEVSEHDEDDRFIAAMGIE